MTKTGTCGGDKATVTFDQISHQGETDPETRVSAPGCWVRLDKQIEHVWQDFGGNADSGIANADDGLAHFPSHV